jgi:hypothetical protein
MPSFFVGIKEHSLGLHSIAKPRMDKVLYTKYQLKKLKGGSLGIYITFTMLKAILMFKSNIIVTFLCSNTIVNTLFTFHHLKLLRLRPK